MEMNMKKHMDMKKMNMTANECKILPFCSEYQDADDPRKIDECNRCGFYFLGMPWTAINFRRFSMEQPLLYVLPNAIYEFKASAKGPHPMHNHVNPFQVMENVGSEGFMAMKGDWRDTFGYSGTYTFRIITLDFVGRNIIHCHTLTHEDTGMMAFYEIVNVTESDSAAYTDASEWAKLCRREMQKTMEEEDTDHPIVTWCKSNKMHCAATVGTGLAVAFL
mmetsp:Transcript_58114/g.92323  ORF Transcript_58114/g.92323 Transcript_58114/m.92323 type:complete len:220 (-) Transcript_58114:147-806(-)